MPQTRLYLVIYPNHSLIASQIDPAAFARHYAQGSTSFLGGNFLFAEVDPDFRSDYFRIEDAYAELKPHHDGRPKSTKFVSNYRTLEHIDFDALGDLYYCNSFGDYVVLKAGEFDTSQRGDEMRIFFDINPTNIVALSKYTFTEYAQFITEQGSFIGAPSMVFTQIEFSVDDFLEQFAANPFVAMAIPGIHPSRLRDAILEVRRKPKKINKGISLNCPFDKVSYKSLRRGFMFASSKKNKFYPLLSLEEIESNFYKFWKTL